MGGSGLSSKRKSSKKKSSKISSEARLKKKSRRNKSKKLRRRDDSASYSDDDSTSSKSVSFSSSEDEYKSRRARSRKRSDVKSSKKKGRRRSPSRSSGEDSPRVKKRKRSKKNVKSEVKKKTQKKKRRKDAHISSPSSDSLSCSTCHGSGSEDSEFERSRGRSRGKNKDKRALGKARSGTKKRKNRSPSRSPCRRHSESSGDRSEMLAVVNNSRRLKSVITVITQTEENEENDWDKDEHKEEIVCDHDEYPSCRSNDSNDGGSKKELAHHSHVASQKRRRVENVEEAVASVSSLELEERGKNGGSEYDGSNRRYEGVAIEDSRKENDSTVPATIDDLESILRQKALENLRKFRGGVQTNARTPTDQKNKGDDDARQFSTAKAEFGQIKSPTQDSRPTLRRDSSRSTRIEGKIPDEKYSGTESETAKQKVVCSPDRTVMVSDPKEKDYTTAWAVANKFESSRSELRHESSGTLQASSKANMLVAESKSIIETSQVVAQSSSNNDEAGVINAQNSAIPESSSCAEPTSAEHGSKERQDEAKDGSKLEEKTMSVMRGGELVQVSYKVYIPKKTPALARRQLKR